MCLIRGIVYLCDHYDKDKSGAKKEWVYKCEIAKAKKKSHCPNPPVADNEIMMACCSGNCCREESKKILKEDASARKDLSEVINDFRDNLGEASFVPDDNLEETLDAARELWRANSHHLSCHLIRELLRLDLKYGRVRVENDARCAGKQSTAKGGNTDNGKQAKRDKDKGFEAAFKQAVGGAESSSTRSKSQNPSSSVDKGPTAAESLTRSSSQTPSGLDRAPTMGVSRTSTMDSVSSTKSGSASKSGRVSQPRIPTRSNTKDSVASNMSSSSRETIDSNASDAARKSSVVGKSNDSKPVANNPSSLSQVVNSSSKDTDRNSRR